MNSILLIEDDETLGGTLSERLEKEGYHLHWSKTLSDAVSTFAASRFDLALVDIGLPDGSGFTFAREAKASSNTPIIFLTAMNSAEYRLEGFEIGADDYVPKPFHLKELLLRIKKVLEAANSGRATRNDRVVLNLESLSITLPDGRTEYPIPRDFELLKLLMESAPKVLSRQEAISRLWNSDTEVTPRTVDNAIVRLRAHLGEIGDRYIRSVRGVGYQWIV